MKLFTPLCQIHSSQPAPQAVLYDPGAAPDHRFMCLDCAFGLGEFGQGLTLQRLSDGELVGPLKLKQMREGAA